jgi:hypothetical protein
VVNSAVRASRRSRLIARVRTLHALAAEIEPHDPAGANALRALPAERVQRLTEIEQQALRRRFDPAALFAYAVFILPAGLGSFFAWTYGGWWTWPVLIVSASYAAIVLACDLDAVLDGAQGGRTRRSNVDAARRRRSYLCPDRADAAAGLVAVLVGGSLGGHVWP